MFIQKNAIFVYGIVTLVTLLVLSGLLFLVAKTGLVMIPFFSRWYQPPELSHFVAPSSLSSDQFLQMIQSRVQASSQGGSPPYRVRVSESEAAGALQSSVQTALRSERWDRMDILLAVHAEDIEVVGLFARGWIHPQFHVRFVPVVERGGLRFDPVSARVGDVSLPASWVTPVLGWMFSRDFGVWTISFGAMSLQRVSLEDGAIDLEIAPAS